MTFTAAVTQTPQHSFLNGGTGVESRQYSARPTQHAPNGPRITPGITGMVPGEFRTIWLSAESQIFSTQNEANGGWYDGLDWTPRAAWNAESQQIVIGMRRGTYKVIAYSDVTGDWRELPTPIPYGRATGGTAHFYGFIDDRPDGKVLLYSLQNEDFLLDPATETYEGPRAKHLLTNGGNGSMIAYNGAGEVIKYSGDAKRWLAYSEAANTWTLRASGLPNGMHALLEYNPSADTYLLVGGTLTSQKATLVTPAGVATPVTDCPQPIAMSSGSWIAYHPSGCWLVRGWPDGAPGNLYACWPNADKTDVVWQDLGVAPDNGLTYSTAAVDYDRGMIYIVSTTGLHAYKLPEVTDPDGEGLLSAVGVSVSAGNAVPSIAIDLSSIGLAVSAGTATLSSAASGDLEAGGQAAAQGSAALVANVTISASGLAQAAASAGLSAAVLLAGAGAAQAAGNATLAASLHLLAAGSAQASGSATITGYTGGQLAAGGQAQALGSAALVLDVRLQAAGTATATGSATLDSGSAQAIAASGGAQAAGTGQISAQVVLTGAGFVQAMGAGYLVLQVDLAAAGAAVATGSATAVDADALVLIESPLWAVDAPGRRWVVDAPGRRGW